MNDWRTQSEKLLRKVAGADLQGVPVYLVDTAEAPPEYLAPSCLAFTGTVLDLGLQPVIQAAGKWQGRGFCTLVFVADITREHDDPIRAARAVSNVILHEGGHFFETLALHRVIAETSGQPYKGLPERDDLPASSLAALAPSHIGSPIDHDEAQPWRDHGSNFARVACHITERCERAGFSTSPTILRAAGGRFGMSPAWKYREALGDEPQRRINDPISLILLDSPPPEFEQLFQSDKEAHRRFMKRKSTTIIPDPDDCEACKGWRKILGRENRVSESRRGGRRYLRCANCGATKVKNLQELEPCTH